MIYLHPFGILTQVRIFVQCAADVRLNIYNTIPFSKYVLWNSTEIVPDQHLLTWPLQAEP